MVFKKKYQKFLRLKHNYSNGTKKVSANSRHEFLSNIYVACKRCESQITNDLTPYLNLIDQVFIGRITVVLQELNDYLTYVDLLLHQAEHW